MASNLLVPFWCASLSMLSPSSSSCPSPCKRIGDGNLGKGARDADENATNYNFSGREKGEKSQGIPTPSRSAQSQLLCSRMRGLIKSGQSAASLRDAFIIVITARSARADDEDLGEPTPGV